MKVWIAKAVIQKAISFLPFKHKINFLFQKYVTRGVRLTDTLFHDKFSHLRSHVLTHKQYAGRDDFAALEIGTGWYPVVPIGLYLSGASVVYTIDISSLLNAQRVRQTIEKFLALKEEDYGFPVMKDRMDKLRTLCHRRDVSATELLSEINISVIVGDARSTTLPEHSVDLITSNNTFEHIYPEILIDILKEFKRLLRQGGVMSHAIDMSDHFAHLDKSISPYNFLQFSDRQWKWIDNDIQPQNRMRIYEYEALYRKVGLNLTKTHITGAGDASINRVKLHARFSGHPSEQNAVVHATIISKG